MSKIYSFHFFWRLMTVGLFLVLLFGAPLTIWRVAVVASVSDSVLTATEREAAANLRTETIRDVTTILASSEMQGRGTAQAGGEKAAQYIADRFAALGVKPIGQKGSYLQRIEFKETQILPETSLKVGNEELNLGRDFVVSPPYTTNRNIGGNIAFVAYGLVSSSLRRDDFRGVNVKGKVAMLIDGPPTNVSKQAWDKSQVRQTIIQNLINQGAIGLIITHTGSQDRPYALIADHLLRRRVTLANATEAPAGLPPFLLVSDEGAEKLFAGSDMTYKEALARAERGEHISQNLKKFARISIRLRKAKGVGSNVIGLIEGSDPNLKEQAIVYTAHYDAFGIDSEQRIFHGAADNALGVGEVISIAEAIVRSIAHPRRSIVFLISTGEEYGLLGSEYWIDHPTWKIKEVAANLNFDGIGTEVYGPVKRVVGIGAEHSDLRAELADVAMAFGTTIANDPFPEEKLIARSDHYAFIKKGIPAVKILGIPEGDMASFVARTKKWRQTDYHQPTDTVRAEWNWDGARTLALIGLIMGLRVANADVMPAWLKSSPYNRSRGTSDPPPQIP